MLGLSHKLIFPKLIFIKETMLTRNDTNCVGPDINVYKLDWSKNNALSEYPALPDPYDDWINGLQFALDRKYRTEIVLCANKARIEWGTERSFDTMIREICLKPAIAYTEVAFKLMADCIYDPEADYYYRGDDKILVSHALMYKLWSNQTGRGLYKEHSDFHRIEWLIESEFGFKPDEDKYQTIKKFLDAIDEHKEVLEVQYQHLGVEGDVEGDTIGEDD